MDRLAAALLRYSEAKGGTSPFETPVPGVLVLRVNHEKPPTHMIFRPSMCIVAQGAKWASFGDTHLQYRAGQALVVGVDTPSVGRVTGASPEAPFLCLALELDLSIMREVAEGLEQPPKAGAEPCRGVFVTDFEGPLADCALRIVRLLDTPAAIPTLYPNVMREICYWLLTGPHGAEVARMTLAASHAQRVIAAMQTLRRRFAEPVRIEELARVAQMSVSAFHRQFKALTSQTPLQYQKQLRLLEARRLLVSTSTNVEAAAYAVGYESPSQFSRDYARMFGAPPKREATQAKAAFLEDGEPLTAFG